MLDELVKTLIRESGPISVAQFMQLALYDPKYGYYTTREPFGRGGDFTTAPEISQVFGEMIGLWIADYWVRSGAHKLRLIECGPGRGTLMQDILRATSNVPEMHAKMEVVLVEISPRLIELQQKALAEYKFITWQPDLSAIPADRFNVIIGNEFLDALPIHQMIGDVERRIGLHGDELCFIGKGTIREECPGASLIARECARLILGGGGVCLFIDYGYAETCPPEGTLQAVKSHKYHPLFDNIGEADLTALVDFATLAAEFKAAGLLPSSLLTQGLFLERMQVLARHKRLAERATAAQKAELDSALERLISPTQMGTLFKVFCATHPRGIFPHGFE
jgi:NADH dehydrogenase [ubiquinone] 1 alpha subcomplex assembly factor 7